MTETEFSKIDLSKIDPRIADPEFLRKTWKYFAENVPRKIGFAHEESVEEAPYISTYKEPFKDTLARLFAWIPEAFQQLVSEPERSRQDGEDW